MSNSQQPSNNTQAYQYNGEFALPYQNYQVGTALSPIVIDDTSEDEKPDESIETALLTAKVDFLKNVLSKICRDNMCGATCKTPDACHRVGFLFACPEYFIKRPCEHEEFNVLSHDGYKHTIMGCHVDEKVDCEKKHDDGRPCRTKVTYYHVRAACPSLRGGERCNTWNCDWGHMHEDVRKHVMTARRRME